MSNNGTITINDLNTRFRASGAYTIYKDESVTPVVNSGVPLRLIYGFSSVGQFNTPLFIEQRDFERARRLFGNRDLTLENNGSFLHLALEENLENGPVLALNLLKTNNSVDETGAPTADADVVGYKSFSTDVATTNGNVNNKLYASFYNKERFWKASPAYLLATRNITDKNKLLSLVNLSQTPYTIIIKKSEIRGYDVSVREWYNNENIPPYLNPSDLIKDYFVDVIVIFGDYSNYEALSTDAALGQYFDTTGLIASKLNEFLSRPEIRVAQIFQGSLIPDFIDKNGKPQYIEAIINSTTSTTGLLCAVDKKELNKYADGENQAFLDIVGHRLVTENVTEVNFLSYKKRILRDYGYAEDTENKIAYFSNSSGITTTYQPGKILVAIASTHPLFNLLSLIQIGDYFEGTTTGAGVDAGITIGQPVLTVSSKVVSNSQVVFTLTSPLKENETSVSGSFVDLREIGSIAETRATTNFTVENSGEEGDIAKLVVNFDYRTQVVLGQYTVQSGDTDVDIAEGLEAAVNALTGTHGYSSTNTDEVLTVTAPVGTFSLPNFFFYPAVEITPASGTATTNTLVIEAQPFENGAGNPTGIKAELELTKFEKDGTDTFFLADKKSQIYKDVTNGELTDGDKLVTTVPDTYYVKFEKIYSSVDFREQLKVSFFTDEELTIPMPTGDVPNFGGTLDSFGYPVSMNVNFQSIEGNMNERLEIDSVINATTFLMDIDQEPNIKIGDYVKGFNNNNVEILSRITAIKRIKDNEGVPIKIEVTCTDKAKIYNFQSKFYVERFKPIEKFFTNFDVTVLKGFSLKSTHKPNGTNARMKDILSVMTDTNVREALIDPELIDFRYIVDTFNHGLETQSKRKLAMLAKDRSKCLGLLNAPSIQEFMDSTDPRFTETPTPTDPLPVLNVAYIRDGANLEENPDFLYTLPEEVDGASYVGFFINNLIIKENGRETSVPPAVYVAKNFVAKFSGGNPFKPTAGERRGVLTGNNFNDVEYPLSKDQRGLLEQKGINPIYKKNNGTYVIGGNQTSYQKFRSVLNSIHVRDLLISIEIDHEAILNSYVFEYNDDNMRNEVSTIIESNLKSYQNGYGALQSFDIIFDRNNNPDPIIREDAAIVDVIVEPTGAVRKFIQRITLRRGSNVIVGAFAAF